MTRELPFAAITMGDAAGIGPEVIVKALGAYCPERVRPVVIGNYGVFTRAAAIVEADVTLNRIARAGAGNYVPGVVNIVDVGEALCSSVEFGRSSSIAGRASIEALRVAHDISRTESVKAIVSAPLHKQAMVEAGSPYADECELMAELTGASMPLMLLISDALRMATVAPLHVSLRKACENISLQQVLGSLRVLHQGLVSLGIGKPRIGVAALNPHAGEGGLLGDEEITAISPAIAAARTEGCDAHGPYPADSLFFRAARGEFDAVLAMYHDQGRIAMKTTDFGRLVSVMIGVPVPYVTVAHGTAYEIAGTGAADAGNFIEVLRFVDRL